MTEYVAPIRDHLFVIRELGDFDEIAKLPGNEELSEDLLDAILTEAGKFAGDILSPLNSVGDIEGCSVKDGRVQTPTGWDSAYDAYRDNGWPALAAAAEFGGQALPKLISTAVDEMWGSANLAFSLLSLLTHGAIEALDVAGSETLKSKYLPRMIDGAWSGTMNLTEPNAGSDLSAVRTRAEPQPDGTYRIFGQKIFISYGDHEITENVIHLVLARLPDAPPGVKGISLFVCPKYLVESDRTLGQRNDVHCLSVEHKLGIHGSPTCVMAFGEHGGAVAEIIGQPNCGLEYMFIMMNHARFSVGLEGLSIAERAYQKARAYAYERQQGRDILSGENNVPIVRHLDVRRMLLLMRSKIMALRSLIFSVGAMFDLAHKHPDKDVSARNQRFVDLLIPIVKAWGTEVGNEVAYLGVQIHGGMGFIEETGAAQYMRDARILPIYEGTNGIQALDLVGRKVQRDQGAALIELIAQMKYVHATLSIDDMFQDMAKTYGAQLAALEKAARWVVSAGALHAPNVIAGATPFLQLMGTVCGSWQMSRLAIAARRQLSETTAHEAGYAESLIGLARFYLAHLGVEASAHAERVCTGGDAITEFDPAYL